MKLEFTIKGAFYKGNCLPTWNDYINECRTNKFGANNFKKRFQRTISVFCPKVPTIDKPYKLNLELGETSHRRDKDNAEGFAKKLINDTLQNWLIVLNDNQYDGGETKFVYGKEPYIKVELITED